MNIVEPARVQPDVRVPSRAIFAVVHGARLDHRCWSRRGNTLPMNEGGYRRRLDRFVHLVETAVISIDKRVSTSSIGVVVVMERARSYLRITDEVTLGVYEVRVS